MHIVYGMFALFIPFKASTMPDEVTTPIINWL